MNDRLIVSRRAQLRVAQPTTRGSLPKWVADRLPALPAPSQPRDHDSAAWTFTLAILGHPDHKLPKRARRNRGGPYRFDPTCGDGDGRTSRNVHFFAPGNPLCTL